MRIIYFDLNNSGISGDMLLASLLDLVPTTNEIIEKLLELKEYLPGVSQLNIELKRILNSGIQINKLKILIKESKNHRSVKILKDSLNKFLNEKDFSKPAKNYANEVMASLVQAEAEVHGKLAKNVHLHELSSVDTLIDILGVTSVLDAVNGFDENFKVYCSKIPLGGGKIKTAHGLLSVPAPATLKILEKSNLLTVGGPIESELVTPTGAALLTNLNPKFLEFLPEMIIRKSIFSTGQKEFKNFANILRLFSGEGNLVNLDYSNHPLKNIVEKVSILETDVDDISGEIIGNFINELKKEKILDVQVIPSLTKKNRPSHAIRILCHPRYKFEIIERIIHELGTLGVRYHTINRVCILRAFEKQTVEINKKKYEINLKISYVESVNGKEIVNIKPEYEDIKKISIDSGIPVRKVQLIVQSHTKYNGLRYSNDDSK
ncbi:hypothetical protein LCGC14_1029140 [marine sediment metagenome]|uniref:Nickel pincer cofactor biosynthesis protein LarC n=1 Tax=marine sediment metagenome TaxID=412755 RepID=A0A0F9NGV9_9ZZZZ|nr:MAG: hypothetical protein Lokiarch_44280 [Candidatus Lokiarchaeum sp. GC14_75]